MALMKELVLTFFEKVVPKGQTIDLQQIYSGIYSRFPDECRKLGITSSKPIEKKWKNEIRFGLWDARKKGLIKHVGTPKSGQWQRI